MMANDKIVIFDTTLRDGEQAPGFSMTEEGKLRMARALAALRVDVIEAGFAAASPGDARAITRLAVMIWVVSTVLVTPKVSTRVFSAITISSSAALPARSPMPLTEHSICRAPPRTAASELATAMPRSSWQCAEKITPAAPSTWRVRNSNKSRISSGVV